MKNLKLTISKFILKFAQCLPHVAQLRVAHSLRSMEPVSSRVPLAPLQLPSLSAKRPVRFQKSQSEKLSARHRKSKTVEIRYSKENGKSTKTSWDCPNNEITYAKRNKIETYEDCLNHCLSIGGCVGVAY